jgi:hypothetical protein
MKMKNTLEDSTPNNINKKEKEYQSFIEIINKNNIPYCMDSGVLLGLMRDGKLFDHEKDIDLQMWVGNENKVTALIPQLEAMGWKVTLWLYKGLIYQIRIQRPKAIPIHIMLFRKHGEWAWCPAGRATGSPFSSKLGRYVYWLFVKIRRKLRNRLVTTDVTRWPWRVRRDLATWWIPASFFENTVFNEKHNVYIPGQWDKYLQYRYGNWRLPVEDWDFWVDDGALNQRVPEELVDIHSYACFDK